MENNNEIYYIEFNSNEMTLKENIYIIDRKHNNHYMCRELSTNTHHVFNEKIIDKLINHKDVYCIFCKEKDRKIEKSIIETIAKHISEQKQIEINNFLNDLSN